MSGGQSLGRSLTTTWRKRDSELAMLSPDPTDGTVRAWTAVQTQDHVIRLALALRHNGLAAGDRLLLASGPCAEAFLVQVAAWALGAVVVHVDDRLDDIQFAETLQRMKVKWIFAQTLQILGGLELAHGETVSQASLIMLRADTIKGGGDSKQKVFSIPGLLEEGRKRRFQDLDALAKQMFEVPEDARASIVYWPGADGVEAAALSHGELANACPPIPPKWGFKAQTSALFMTPPGTRDGLIAFLRLAMHGATLIFTDDSAPLIALLKKAAPTTLVARGSDVVPLFERLHQERQGKMNVRGVFIRSLGWLERRSDTEDDVQESSTAPTDEGESPALLAKLLERGQTVGLKADLGGQLRSVWTLDGALDDGIQELLGVAGVEVFVS